MCCPEEGDDRFVTYSAEYSVLVIILRNTIKGIYLKNVLSYIFIFLYIIYF